MTTTTKSLKPQVGPTGLCLWKIPGDTGLDIMWAGAGSPLTLGRHTIAHGMMTRIHSLGSDGNYGTRKDAQKAVETFIARANEQLTELKASRP